MTNNMHHRHRLHRRSHRQSLCRTCHRFSALFRSMLAARSRRYYWESHQCNPRDTRRRNGPGYFHTEPSQSYTHAGEEPTYPSVRATARSCVDRAVGIAEQITMCWATLAVARILLSLSLRHLALERFGCAALNGVGLTPSKISLHVVMSGLAPTYSARCSAVPSNTDSDQMRGMCSQGSPIRK